MDCEFNTVANEGCCTLFVDASAARFAAASGFAVSPLVGSVSIWRLGSVAVLAFGRDSVRTFSTRVAVTGFLSAAGEESVFASDGVSEISGFSAAAGDLFSTGGGW